ncbi:uncharacterized protein si:dkey-171c9.3 [Amphiprion ocellaris]|uniref:uncharacterized protein si:dkey-171c9.3 n=1 Tax=Amphiprion ocellaris TaxID=80972 RepID=UPI002410E98B|nr:uncharacterized protein si:dkey-171c9.3 [Amphiprion ocellaris]
MQTVNAESSAPEPTKENLGIPEGHKRSPLDIEAFEAFAQNMAENIIQSFISQMETVEAEVTAMNRDHKMLAEDLASAVIEIALREASRGGNIEGPKSSRSAGVKMDHENVEKLPSVDKSAEEKHVDAEMDSVKELQTCRDFQPHHPPLSQSGLPVVGSLDYPDAPPTTPLLPELERSRHSFARKLKGGLAKVFLPSPPPPTPKEKDSSPEAAIGDHRVDLMEHLMHSLSIEDLTRDSFNVGSWHGASMEAFAEALSCDIIDWVLSAKNREKIGDDRDLHLLAQQLAETIISSSLDEAKMLV